jgi:predicted dehydrogenase
MQTIRAAVVGVGHLGKEHARILAGLPGVQLVGVVDPNPEQAKAIADKHSTQPFTDFRQLLDNVDAVSIAAPTIHHARIAKEFLSRGIHTLVEKPLTPTVAEADLLVEAAAEHGCVFQVGHIERFNPAFEELQRRPLQPKLIRAQRVGPFTGRSTDIGVVLDLMIHDLDLLLALVKSPVASVEALGMTVFGGHEDVANARLRFENGCIAELTASRASPTMARTMQLWGPEGFADVDFAKRTVTMVQPSESVRRSGLDPAKLDKDARAKLRDELFTKYLEMTTVDGQAKDQLTAELSHFADCIRTKSTPRVSGADGRDTVAIAQRILQAIRDHAWNGAGAGPQGAHNLPLPRGPLFQHRVEAA